MVVNGFAIFCILEINPFVLKFFTQDLVNGLHLRSEDQVLIIYRNIYLTFQSWLLLIGGSSNLRLYIVILSLFYSSPYTFSYFLLLHSFIFSIFHSCALFTLDIINFTYPLTCKTLELLGPLTNQTILPSRSFKLPDH